MIISNQSILIQVVVFLLVLNIQSKNMLRAEEVNNKEIVILVHGILNKPFIMFRIENSLKKEGFEVINWGYPSTKKTIEECALMLYEKIKSLKEVERINFVGFSMGNIIIRYYMEKYNTVDVKRFVMIAPPNHGSELATKLYEYKIFRFIFGTKAFKELRHINKKYFDELEVPKCEFGIIAGGTKDGKGFRKILTGDNDGTIKVETTKLNGAKDFIKLNYRHTFILFAEKTSRNVLSFIKDGKFIH